LQTLRKSFKVFLTAGLIPFFGGVLLGFISSIFELYADLGLDSSLILDLIAEPEFFFGVTLFFGVV
jgi:hypothetical protein